LYREYPGSRVIESHLTRHLNLLMVSYLITQMMPTSQPTASPTRAPTSSPTPLHCFSPELFVRDFAGCDAKICSPLLWYLPYLPSNASTTTSPSPEAVCLSMCSKQTLGPLRRDENETVVVESAGRGMCRGRCATDGFGSFLCQVRGGEGHHIDTNAAHTALTLGVVGLRVSLPFPILSLHPDSSNPTNRRTAMTFPST
jgi:hypothetical protein